MLSISQMVCFSRLLCFTRFSILVTNCAINRAGSRYFRKRKLRAYMKVRTFLCEREVVDIDYEMSQDGRLFVIDTDTEEIVFYIDAATAKYLLSKYKIGSISLKHEVKELRIERVNVNDLGPSGEYKAFKENLPKPNWQDYKDVLQRNGITKLYHFTDRRNLESIVEEGGLVSWADACDRNIDIAAPGGSDTSHSLDKRMGLEHYVRLSFVHDHPMMHVAMTDGRIEDPVILEIDPQVVYLANTKFSDRNAARTSAGVKVGDSVSDLRNLRFNLFNKRYFDLDADEKPYYQAEVLVCHEVPLCYIRNITSVYHGYINRNLLITPEEKEAEAERFRKEIETEIEAETQLLRKEIEEWAVAVRRAYLDSIRFGLAIGGNTNKLYDKVIVRPGESVRFYWEANADVKVSIFEEDEILGLFPSTLFDGEKSCGSYELKPSIASTYYMCVTPIGGEALRKKLTVEVREPAILVDFAVDHESAGPDDEVFVSWIVRNADSVELIGVGRQNLSGSMQTKIRRNTQFKLVVKDCFGSREYTKDVRYVAPTLFGWLRIYFRRLFGSK